MNINTKLTNQEILNRLVTGYNKFAEEKKEHSYLAELLMPHGFRDLKDDWNYGTYVTKHKYNVYTAGRDMDLPRLQLLKHDLSKYKPSEFVPYRKWFEGPTGLKGTQDPETYLEWRRAVDKHYNNSWNTHHWRKLGLTPSQVPMETKLESVADWYSVAKTNKRTDASFKNWYHRNRDKLPIDNSTKDEIALRLTKVSAKKSHFQILKDHRVSLTDVERAEVMKSKAVWHHGPNGEETPAVWKSVVNGKTSYVTNTHRAYQEKQTLKEAIRVFHSFIKGTA